MANPIRFDERFAAVSAVLLFCGGAWMIGCGGGGHNSASNPTNPYAQSVQNVVHLQLGLELYENDFDFVLPTSEWMDGLLPYTHNAAFFHSPNASGAYGYALNSSIVGLAYSKIAEPDTVLSIFDSTVLTRNATGSSSTLPSPPRYGAKNTLGYLDGETADAPTGLSTAQSYSLSQQRLGRDDLGLLQYANDYDDTLPLGGKWMDELGTYVKDDENFHSPLVEVPNPTAYGYAMNAVIAGQAQTLFASPSTVVSLFDSTDVTRNATDPLTTLPNPPRYGTSNTISFLDGHVQTSSKPATKPRN